MKEYPLEIFAVPEFEGCSNLGYASKGHHNKQEFLAELFREHLNGVTSPTAHLATPKNVSHQYWRNVPQATARMMSVACEPGPGAYPVTYFDEYGARLQLAMKQTRQNLQKQLA